jgi:D-inositol-3-phosphate glycosyltransferase
MKFKSLQIALVSEHASPLALAGGVDSGGQNVYVAHVARELAAAGHRVDVLTRRDDAQSPAVVELADGVRVWHVDAGPARFVPKEDLLPYMSEFSLSARQWMLRRPPLDVIHANFFMSGWVGLELRRQFTVPLVITFHALGLVRREHQREADRFPAERIGIERTLVRDSDRLVAACPQDAADLRRLYEAAPERIASVPCGVDADALRPGDRRAARRRLGLPQHEFIVLQLGRLVPRKGIDNVVHAMAALRQADPALPTRLVVVGGDADTPDEVLTPEIGRLRGIAREQGVADRVQFTGRRGREQLRDWYVAADVFVTTPWYEPFGITPLEAMACGTPVIGSAVGGVRHTVLDGITGFLVPPREPRLLADRLLQLQRDPARAAAFGSAGVQRVRSHFTWDEVARQLVQVYRSVCDHARLQAPRAGRSADVAAANHGALGLVSAS